MKTIKPDVDFKLTRNAAGQLQFTAGNGTVHDNVHPVRAFPISAPDEGLSIFSKTGHELAWICDLAAMPAQIKELIAADLAQREFMPVILRIRQVSSFTTPSIWHVDTDIGTTQLHLKAEDQIWRLKNGRLLITDKNGVNFMINNLELLDNHSKKLLDRFL